MLNNLMTSVSVDIAVIVLLSVIGLSSSDLIFQQSPFFTNKIRSTISKLIHHTSTEHYLPLTIRVLVFDSSNSESEFDWKLVKDYPLLIGDNKPLKKSVEPRSISSEKVGYMHIFRYVVVIWITNLSKYDDLLEKIEKTINRRWDRLLLISSDEIITKVVKEHAFISLKEKLAISYERGNIWLDPLVYNKGEMITLKSIADLQTIKKSWNQPGRILRQRHFKVGANEFKPQIYKIGEDSSGNALVAGTAYEVIAAAASYYNFTFDIVYTRLFLHILPNGTWTGVMSYVYYSKVDFSVASSLSTTLTFSYDYPSITGEVGITFFVGPPKTSIEWYAMVLPFSPEVWAWTGITFMFVNIVSLIVMYILHNRKMKRIVLETGIFMSFAIAMEQGLTDIPKGVRYIAVVWLLGTVVLGTGYKSTLRTNLMLPVPQKVPTTLEELAQRPDYKITIFKKSETNLNTMLNATGYAIKDLKSRLQVEPDFEKLLENTYLTPKIVGVAWYPMIQAEIAAKMTFNSKVDPLLISQNAIQSTFCSIPFQKNSIFVDAFSRVTAAVFENGLGVKFDYNEISKLKKIGVERVRKEKAGTQLYKMLQEQAEENDWDTTPLTLWNFRAVFAILLIGCLLGSCTFLVEIAICNAHVDISPLPRTYKSSIEE